MWLCVGCWMLVMVIVMGVFGVYGFEDWLELDWLEFWEIVVCYLVYVGLVVMLFGVVECLLGGLLCGMVVVVVGLVIFFGMVFVLVFGVLGWFGVVMLLGGLLMIVGFLLVGWDVMC